MRILSIITILLLSQNIFSQTTGKSESEKKTTESDITVLSIDQQYEGKNIFVNNPFSTREEGGLCITDVVINNSTIHLSQGVINATAFEIPLDKYNIKLGDHFNVKIYHLNGCSPTILRTKK